MTRSTRWSGTLVLAALMVGQAAWGQDAKGDKKTERLWKAKCASCHGPDGKAQTDKGKQMKIADYSTAEWQKGRTDEAIKKAIVDGVKAEKGGVKQEMDGYKADLTPEQVDALVKYTRALGPK